MGQEGGINPPFFEVLDRKEGGHHLDFGDFLGERGQLFKRLKELFAEFLRGELHLPVVELFLAVFGFLIICQTFLRLPGVRKITRPIEVLLTKICSRILLALLGVYDLNYKCKRQDSKRYNQI